MLYELSYCLELMGLLETSVSYYQKFIDTDPYSEYAWYNIGIVYNKLKQYENALDAYEFAIAIDDGFSSAHFNIGNTYMNLNQYDKALEAYLIALELEGPGAEIYCNMAAVYEKMEQYEIGIRYYTKASKLDPMYHEAWYGICVCLSLKEKWLDASHFFKKAVKIDIQNASYLRALAEAEYCTGNIVSAIEIYEELGNLDQVEAEVYLDWSRIYYDQGNFLGAISIIEMGLSSTPDDPDYLYRKAVYLLADGKYQESMVILEQALILDFDGHEQIYDFFKELSTQKALFKIIDQFRKEEK